MSNHTQPQWSKRVALFNQYAVILVVIEKTRSLACCCSKEYARIKRTRGGHETRGKSCLAAAAASSAALHLLELALELLDLGVGLLEILVETVSLGNELLFPLAETLLLDLDLLGEALAERLLLLLVLGVVELARPGLAEFAGLHLLGAVGLVVQLLGGVDKVQHVSSDQDRSELLEVAVVLVLDLGYTP